MEQPHKKIKKSASKTKFSSAELKYRRSSTTFAQNDNCVPHRLVWSTQEKWKQLERMLDAINTENERNNESSLPNWISHFFLPLFSQKPFLFP